MAIYTGANKGFRTSAAPPQSRPDEIPEPRFSLHRSAGLVPAARLGRPLRLDLLAVLGVFAVNPPDITGRQAFSSGG